VPHLRHVPSHYLHHHLVVSTSGNYLPAAFECTREVLGMRKIVLGSDHPYEEMTECLAFLASLGLTAQEESLLFAENAAALGFQV
jgi:predicted TIM-barrel fold metal-dependent hydrolase